VVKFPEVLGRLYSIYLPLLLPFALTNSVHQEYWNGDHEGEGNEADTNLPGRRGLDE
jgi:hypothetical protein